MIAVHLGVAGMAKNPIWALDQQEAKSLAEAAQDVANHYNFEASKEAMLWVNLLTALAAVYAPRVMMTIQASKKDKPKPQAPQQTKPAPIPDAAPVSNSPDIGLPKDFDASLFSHMSNG